MKKFFSICMIIIYLFNMCTTVYCSEAMEEYVICTNRKEFLIKSGFIDESFLDKQYLSRSDCVKIAFKFTQDDEHNKNSRSDLKLSEIFHDMPEYRDDYNIFFDMYFLHNYGRGPYVYLSYIYGDERGMRPDDLITWPEFVALFLRVTDWDVYIYLQKEHDVEHYMNSYPDKYFEIAEKLGITPLKKEGYVQIEDALNFIYSIMHVPRIAGAGFSTPDGMSYGPFYPWIECIYIDSMELLGRLKEIYANCAIDEGFMNKFISVCEYPGRRAIMVNDPVMFDTSWVPAEIRAHGIIGFPELSWWFVNK